MGTGGTGGGEEGGEEGGKAGIGEKNMEEEMEGEGGWKRGRKNNDWKAPALTGRRGRRGEMNE